jgi:hypothetical protein
MGATFRGIMNSGVVPLVAWIAARELFGTPAAVALGGVIIFKHLVESTRSRTLQASLLIKLNEMQERAVNAIQGPQPPRQPNMGGSPTSPQTGPQMPANRGLAPGQMNLPGGGTGRAAGWQAAQAASRAAGADRRAKSTPQAPTAPPVQTVIPPVRGTMLPEKATRARAGSGDYAKPEKSTGTKLVSAVQSGGVAHLEFDSKTPVTEEQVKALFPKGSIIVKQDPNILNVANSGRQAFRIDILSKEGRIAGDVEAQKYIDQITGGGNLRRGDIAKAPAADKTVAPSNILSKDQIKAMQERLSALYDRTPKSGAENNAIKREKEELKKLLSGDLTSKEATEIKDRIRNRERLATQRSEAGTARGAGEASTSGEGVSKAASPDVRMSLLEQGYAHLATLEDGPEHVKTLKKMAKDLKGTDYDEVTALAESIKSLKEAGSTPKEKE